MRSPRRRLLVYVAVALVLALAVTALSSFGGIALNPWWVGLVALALAVLVWLLFLGDAPARVSWPQPRTLSPAVDDAHERGIAQAMTMFSSADNGSVLSTQDVANALTDVAARKLILNGADPEAPFAAADTRLSPQLLRLCRACVAKQPVARLSRQRIDAYLKEILAL